MSIDFSRFEAGCEPAAADSTTASPTASPHRPSSGTQSHSTWRSVPSRPWSASSSTPCRARRISAAKIVPTQVSRPLQPFHAKFRRQAMSTPSRCPTRAATKCCHLRALIVCGSAGEAAHAEPDGRGAAEPARTAAGRAAGQDHGPHAHLRHCTATRGASIARMGDRDHPLQTCRRMHNAADSAAVRANYRRAMELEYGFFAANL